MINQELKYKTLFCIVGETASGKDTLVKRLTERFPDKLRAVCSYTDRPKRDSETNGVEHYFLSKKEFNSLHDSNIQEVIAYTKIDSGHNDGYQYMALLPELKKANIYVIDPRGLKYLKNNFSNKIENIVTIYINASLEDRVRRAKSTRSDYKTEFKKRVENEQDQFVNFRINKEYDYMVNNSDGNDEYAFEVLCNIIKHYIDIDIPIRNSNLLPVYFKRKSNKYSCDKIYYLDYVCKEPTHIVVSIYEMRKKNNFSLLETVHYDNLGELLHDWTCTFNFDNLNSNILIFKSKYNKKDLIEALDYLRASNIIYENNFINDSFILSKIDKSYSLIRNLILEKID